MLNKILKVIIFILMIVGIIMGVSISAKRQSYEINKQENKNKMFEMLQTQTAEATAFYTYGRAFNISGKILNVNKDNFESAKIYITDGMNYEKTYNLDYYFEDSDLVFSSQIINSEIILDKLENKQYYIFLRLKLNNSIDPRFYSFSNYSDDQEIEYYTITSDSKNKRVLISFIEEEYKNKNYNVLTLKIEESSLPKDVYDIIIDAGHGGKDIGENSGNITEADITLEYAKLLKYSLESEGFKVALTRNDYNSDTFTFTNMYDDNGRISIACKSKAKLMISFHVNNGANELNGFEIFSPCKSDLSFAIQMAQKIKEYSTISYSNKTIYKQSEGVYVENFTKSTIKDLENSAKKRGFEPYNVTTDTPYLYTIREVGGIATGAYVDGRNTQYSKNEYYKSNQGIECYQIELGYIKKDLEIIKNEKNAYIRAITEAIVENFK